MPSSPEYAPGSADPLDSSVLHATDNGVSWITLNRPEAMNAVTWDQRERLIALLARASADPAVRAVVLTATGRGFCAGADLRGAPSTGDRIPGDVARTIRLGAQRLIAAVLDCEKPVIAAVNGTAAASAHISRSPATWCWPPTRRSSSRCSYAAASYRTAAARTCCRV